MNVHVPALQRSLTDVVAEYDTKREALVGVIERFHTAIRDVEMASVVAGTYVGSIWGRYGDPKLHKESLERNLAKSAWKHVYEGLNINLIASAKDRSRFDLTLENPPEFTLDNLRATFGDYILNSRFHILKGLAEQFCDLDPAYKSHSRVKVGVEGLPKRIVMGYMTDDWGISYRGKEKLRDVVNALFTYLAEPLIEWQELGDWGKEAWTNKSAEHRGMTLKLFKNGNAHLHFSMHRLDAINRALAEFYGDVLPDSPEASAEVRKKTSTAIAKDLQFYPTPAPVMAQVLADIYLRSAQKILEPSCGDGRFMEAIKREAPQATVVGIEVDPGRVATCKTKGLPVLQGNFLQVTPVEDYDAVIMNPPFYGLHWKKHLLHALRFLKVGGSVVCILPAAAEIDGHLDDIKSMPGFYAIWRNLPTASFKENGTNIATGYVAIGRRK